MGWCERVGGPGSPYYALASVGRVGLGWVGLPALAALRPPLHNIITIRILVLSSSIIIATITIFIIFGKTQPPCTTCNTASSAMLVVQFKKRGDCNNLLRILLINLVPNCSLSTLTDLVIMGEVVSSWRRKKIDETEWWIIAARDSPCVNSIWKPHDRTNDRRGHVQKCL